MDKSTFLMAQIQKIMMKLVKENYDENEVTLIPQDSDDLYLLYNLLAPNDRLTARTTRRLKRNEGGGSDNSSRVQVTLSTKVISVAFAGFGEVIRVKGTIAESSDTNVTLGSHHTHKIELLKPITITKKQGWSQFSINQIKDSQLGTLKGVLLVAIDDESAIISQLGSHATKILLELYPSIPRKSSDPNQHKIVTLQFYAELAKFLQNILQEQSIEQIYVGGPGFTHESFVDFIKSEKPKLVKFIQNYATQASGRGAITEMIQNNISEKTMVAKEAKRQIAITETILDHLSKNTGLVVYGLHVFNAATIGAVDKLLILDTQLQDTIEKRSRLEKLIDDVSQTGASVIIMSSMHQPAEVIKGFGGVVAILRFKLPKSLE